MMAGPIYPLSYSLQHTLRSTFQRSSVPEEEDVLRERAGEYPLFIISIARYVFYPPSLWVCWHACGVRVRSRIKFVYEKAFPMYRDTNVLAYTYRWTRLYSRARLPSQMMSWS